MPVLFLVCAIVVTIAILAIAFSLVRALSRVVPAIEELRLLVPEVRRMVASVDQLVDETRSVLEPLRELTPAARRVAFEFELIGERAARIASALVDEVEAPVITAVRLARGIRAGTAYLLKQWTNRSTVRTSHLNGGHHHE